MADRNPNVPSERRRDVEDRARDTKDEAANQRYAEKQAQIAKDDAPFDVAQSEEAHRKDDAKDDSS
jgi:hypothetical protein